MAPGKAPSATRAKPGSVSEEVARFVAETKAADIPAAVLELGRKSILDALGLAASGSVSDAARLIWRSMTGARSTEDLATVIGGGGLARADLAALANGLAMHVDDYDDIQLADSPDRVYGLLMHPTAAVLPAALAVAERQRSSGPALMRAYHVGVEVACKVAEAIAPRHYEDGFHSTGTCGTIGAAAAAANIMGLPLEQTRHALGLAASHASGLRASFGTMTKALHAGRAAQNGVTAADLARSGFTAAERVLEMPQGFFQAAGGGYTKARITGRLGAPWTFVEPGIAIKPYPCASLTHPAIDLVLDLVHDRRLTPSSIRGIRVGTNSRMPTALRYPQPQTGLEAKFSMEYCVAVAILDGNAGLPQFEDAAVARRDVREVLARIAFEVDPRADAAGLDRMATFLTAELADGTVVEAREDYPRGTPARPLSFEDVTGKFADCASYGGFDAAAIAAVVDKVRALGSLSDVRELTASLRRPAKEEKGFE